MPNRNAVQRALWPPGLVQRLPAPHALPISLNPWMLISPWSSTGWLEGRPVGRGGACLWLACTQLFPCREFLWSGLDGWVDRGRFLGSAARVGWSGML